MIRAVIFTGGPFWLGCSGYRKEVHWIVQTIGDNATGLGISFVSPQVFNYLDDTYLMASPLCYLLLNTLLIADGLNSS